MAASMVVAIARTVRLIIPLHFSQANKDYILWLANFLGLRKSEVQLRRILIPRNPVNKGKRQGRGC
jgi:hypothetical protein